MITLIKRKGVVKTLNQGDGTGLCHGFGLAGFSSQMRGKDAIDDAEQCHGLARRVGRCFN